MIRISGLIKKFGEFVAIDNLSLEINAGRNVRAFLGPNGSGKTTTLKCILGLTAPDQGDIRVQGLHIHEDAREVRRRISYLPQRVSFHDNLTAREVLSFYCRLKKNTGGAHRRGAGRHAIQLQRICRQAREQPLGRHDTASWTGRCVSARCTGPDPR